MYDDGMFWDPTLYRWAKVTLGALLNQGQRNEPETLWAIITFLTGGEFELVLRRDLRFGSAKTGWQTLSREGGPFRVPNQIPFEDAFAHILSGKAHVATSIRVEEDRVA